MALCSIPLFDRGDNANHTLPVLQETQRKGCNLDVLAQVIGTVVAQLYQERGGFERDREGERADDALLDEAKPLR